MVFELLASSEDTREVQQNGKQASRRAVRPVWQPLADVSCGRPLGGLLHLNFPSCVRSMLHGTRNIVAGPSRCEPSGALRSAESVRALPASRFPPITGLMKPDFARLQIAHIRCHRGTKWLQAKPLQRRD